MSARRIRVAVVFGGRSGEHAISCVSADGILRHLDAGPVRRPADRHHPVRQLGAGPAGHAAEHHRRPAARGAGRRRAGAVRRSRAGGRWCHWSAPPQTPEICRLAGRRRGVPGAARPVRRGRHDPGPAGAERRAVRRAPACWPAPPAWTRSSPRSCWPPKGCRSVGSRCSGAASDTLDLDQRERIGLPAFVKPARAGSSLGVSRVDEWDRAGRGDRAGSADRRRRCWWRPRW